MAQLTQEERAHLRGVAEAASPDDELSCLTFVATFGPGMVKRILAELETAEAAIPRLREAFIREHGWRREADAEKEQLRKQLASANAQAERFAERLGEQARRG